MSKIPAGTHPAVRGPGPLCESFTDQEGGGCPFHLILTGKMTLGSQTGNARLPGAGAGGKYQDRYGEVRSCGTCGLSMQGEPGEGLALTRPHGGGGIRAGRGCGAGGGGPGHPTVCQSTQLTRMARHVGLWSPSPQPARPHPQQRLAVCVSWQLVPLPSVVTHPSLSTVSSKASLLLPLSPS